MDNLPDDFYSGRFMVECPVCGNVDHVTEGCACSDGLADCVCGDCAWVLNNSEDDWCCDKCSGAPGSGDPASAGFDQEACDEWADWNEEA